MKLKNNYGFTLAETIIAVGLVLIVTAMLATGLPRAYESYKGIVDSADAHTLISTTMTELRDKLALAKDIQIADDNITINFIGSNGRKYTIESVQDWDAFGDGSKLYTGLRLTDQTGTKTGYDASIGSGSQMLVSNSAASGRLEVKYDSVSYNMEEKYISFINLKVQRIEDGRVMVTVPKYDIKIINR